MLVVALVLLLVAALLVVVGFFGGGEPASLDLGPIELDTTATVVFFLGMATLLILVVALQLFRSAGRRAAARRRDRKKVGELSEKLEHYERDNQDQADTAP